ncbi:hypothetical protein ACQPX6_10945 [Actinomycetospora sp. CA-101289]|uniref:hypothetical protein n=1 Tax=Actinomycetospora sp. CA-101289 TaxID=3239893 RepID=UPI003D9639E6
MNAVFARFQTMRPVPGTDDSEAARRELSDILRRHAGYSGAYYLVSGPSALRALVTLWSTEEDARLSSERTRAASGGGPRPVTIEEDAIYEVTDDEAGAADAAAPDVADVVVFDGPLTDAARAATDRFHRGRILPAVRALPGTVRLLVLWDRLARSMRVLHLANDPATLDAVPPAVNALVLEEDEDPALLSPPDRSDRWEVAAADVPAGMVRP